MFGHIAAEFGPMLPQFGMTYSSKSRTSSSRRAPPPPGRELLISVSGEQALLGDVKALVAQRCGVSLIEHPGRHATGAAQRVPSRLVYLSGCKHFEALCACNLHSVLQRSGANSTPLRHGVEHIATALCNGVETTLLRRATELSIEHSAPDLAERGTSSDDLDRMFVGFGWSRGNVGRVRPRQCP